MKLRVEHSGTVKTYAALHHTAWHLLDHAKTYEEGALLQIKACTVFCAFTFEAYLNHVGFEEIPFWNEIERISYRKKLNVIQSQLELNLNSSRPPFQTVFELFRLRDMLAHGRTVEFEESFETDTEPPIDSVWSVLPWEKLTISQGERYYDAVYKAIEMINSARPTPDDLLWNQGPRSKAISVVKNKEANKP